MHDNCLSPPEKGQKVNLHDKMISMVKLLTAKVHYSKINNYLKTAASNCIHNGSIMNDLVRNVHLTCSQHEVCVSSSPKS